MKIQSVSFLGIRGLRDASYDFTNRDGGQPHEVVVFTGPSASGKTRALEAIIAAKEAIAPYGPLVQGAPWIAAGAAASKIKLAFHLDDEEMSAAGVASPVVETEVTFLPNRARGEAPEGLVSVLKRYSHDPDRGKLEYFPASRRIPMLPPFSGLNTAEQRLARAAKDARKYSFVTRFLRDLDAEPDRAQKLASLLQALSPSVRYVPGSPGDGLPRCLASHGGPAVTPAELSDSEADAVLLATTALAIGLSRSLVLIDRPDQYVDPAYLPQFLIGLRSLGDRNQLILASSSPDLVSAATPAAVVTLEA